MSARWRSAVIDVEVAEMLGILNDGFPAVSQMTGPEARAAVSERRAPVSNLDDVERVADCRIPARHGEIPVRLYFPYGSGHEPLPVVMFFHGGGFVFCDIESHDGFCREMAKETHAIVVSVAYRLAPEHKAPAAAEDAFDALVWAAEYAPQFGGDPRRIVTAGDSAGGNLAAVACLMARESGRSDVLGQVLLYPVIDPSCDTVSCRNYASGFFLTRAALQWYWKQYLDDGRLPEPAHHVAPLCAPSLAGLPPAVVVTAGLDPLCSEGADYAAALRRADVPVTYRRYGGLFHGFLTIAALRASQSARAVLWQDMCVLLANDDS